MASHNSITAQSRGHKFYRKHRHDRKTPIQRIEVDAVPLDILVYDDHDETRTYRPMLVTATDPDTGMVVGTRICDNGLIGDLSFIEVEGRLQ